ncbi:MAG: glucokinase [Pseudomonadota bacterium]|jgi:glucokinase
MAYNNTARLVADIGGTNARFALVVGDENKITQQKSVRTQDHPTFVSAARDYLQSVGAENIHAAAIAVATPVNGDQIKMTNCPWQFSIEAARKDLGLSQLNVLNDFEALALSLPLIPKTELAKIGGGEALEHAPVALLGAGTGLGVASLVWAGAKWTALPGEGGHVSISAANEREEKIIAFTRRQFPHVSAERLLSGMGLQNIYHAIAALSGVEPQQLEPSFITNEALRGGDKLCVEAVEIFCAMLGTVAGNLALTLGARGGVYIGGGIVPKLGDYFARSPFRERFESKGRYKAYLAAIPTYVIHAEYPGLLGAATVLGPI